MQKIIPIEKLCDELIEQLSIRLNAGIIREVEINVLSALYHTLKDLTGLHLLKPDHYSPVLEELKKEAMEDLKKQVEKMEVVK